MSDRVPLLATLAIAALLAVAIAARRAAGRPPEGPEDLAQRVLEAARKGDVNGYLACFSEPLLRRLRDAAAATGEDAFAADLRSRATPVVGLAVSRRAGNAAGGEEAVLDVETVYSDRTERQVYRLRRRGGRWRIVTVESMQEGRMPIPYGKPVM